MNRRYLRTHLSDDAVERSLASTNLQELGSTADLLADIAEFGSRGLFRAAGYSSMFAYCVGHLHRSEAAAYKRIRVARAAQRFPEIFDGIADGRLHLSGVVLLAPYLTEDTAGDLLAASRYKSSKQIQELLAERFPQPDLPTRLQPIAASKTSVSGSVGDVELTLTSMDDPQGGPRAADAEESLELTRRPAQTPASSAAEVRPSLKPLAPQRYALQVTVDQQTYDALCYAQELLSHEVPAGDVAKVLSIALQALIPQLEKRRFAAADKPRPGRQPASSNPRYIPPDVRRAVWKRDGGQCTYVSVEGHRCSERRFIQFDHVHEVARGGEASLAGIRLRCWAHNQYAAERTFGAEFMRHKRLAAAEARGSGGHQAARASPAT